MSSQEKCSLSAFFWSRVNKLEDRECWIWRGAEKHSGYGDCRGKYAHRISWMLHNNRAIPAGLHICHSCDVPQCVNPRHLYIGTAKQNNADIAERRRYRSGARGSRAKLTSGQVAEMRRRAAPLLKDMSREKAAKLLCGDYGVTHYTVRDIIAGKRWTHLNPSIQA